ncbi:hypothetical protein BH09DEP1_BH09DEP1_6370 [soil metagenome]
MFKYIFICLGMAVFICSSSFTMDNFDKEMLEIQKKAEAQRKENAEKFKQMMADSKNKSLEEKAKAMANYLGVPQKNLLEGSQKLLEDSRK